MIWDKCLFFFWHVFSFEKSSNNKSNYHFTLFDLVSCYIFRWTNRNGCSISSQQWLCGVRGRKAGNSYYSFGPNQHVDNIWKFDTKYSDIQPLGAVLDTGAQRRATGTPAEILNRTGTTLNMQPVVGTAKKLQAFSWVLKQSISMANQLFLSYQMCLCTTQACLTA